MTKMKDSGIEWIGQIPEEYQIVRIKDISEFINGYAFKSEDLNMDEDIPVIRIGDICENLRFDDCLKHNKLDNLTPFLVKSGDILTAMSGATVGKNCIVRESTEAYINQRVGIIRSSLNEYIRLILMTDSFKEYIYLLSNGSAQPNISAEQIGAFKITLMKNTKKVTDFLNKKCGEIDRLIEIQEQEIEKLKEYKTSVITKAVTKGLDDSVSMKDSQVKELANIPIKWEIVPFKQVFESGKGLPITKENLTETGIKVISYGQIHAKYNKFVEIDDRLFRFVPSNYLQTNKESLVNKGDFIFADTSEDIEGTGNFIHINLEDPIFAGYHTIIAKNKSNIYSSYYAYLFMSSVWRHQLRSQVSGVKLFSLTKKLLFNSYIIQPPIDEQYKIVEYLDKKCVAINNLILQKQQKIEKLQEYKKSLIYEYVTGKKEVV